MSSHFGEFKMTPLALELQLIHLEFGNVVLVWENGPKGHRDMLLYVSVNEKGACCVNYEPKD